MHYPWWYVPHLTAPMLIAVIATIHVLVAHYAVGGGIFLAVETGRAYRDGDREYLDYLRRHARFFVLLTVVFGAITGVGIWWTIGLASPLATETLIRTFVFGWAMEWVFFVVEIVSAFVFYYYWTRLTPKVHVAIAWIYAIAAWISLVLITAITAFMLNTGGWVESKNFWVAMLNPQFIPQTIARTGGALLLSSLYVYLHASLTLRGAAGARLQQLLQKRSAQPALLGAIMIGVGSWWWWLALPESAQAVIQGAAVLNVFAALLFATTVLVFSLLYFGPIRNPGWLTPGFSISLFLLGIAAFSLGEFIREAARKPYVVYNVVFGNGVKPEEVASLREDGYLESGKWTKKYVAAEYPDFIGGDGKIDYAKLMELEPGDPTRVALGGTIFQYHCNDCHAAEMGYSAVAPLLQGRTRPQIIETIETLGQTHYIMPPWCGRPEEAKLLTDYLQTIVPKRPAGMLPAVEEYEKEGDGS